MDLLTFFCGPRRKLIEVIFNTALLKNQNNPKNQQIHGGSQVIIIFHI